jgi:Lrp/AsnC family leucine-responsive transcriptional regulator
MKKNELDHIDYEILDMLQKDARMPLKEIASKVFLSSPAVSARIDNLVNKGYIQGFHAQINPQVMGYHIKAFINLEVSPKDKKNFYPYIKECRNVVECNCVTGDYSMLLEVLFQSTVELDQFIGELQEYGRTNTLIVFSTSVEHRGVVIDPSYKKSEA